MKCSDLQNQISLYADGMLDEGKAAAAGLHLEICPLCRQLYDEIREVRNGLRQLSRPVLSPVAVDSVRSAVLRELKTEKTSLLPVSGSFREWLRLNVMPYSVGAVASVAIGLGFLSLLFSGSLRTGPFGDPGVRSEPTMLLASNSKYDIDPWNISQTDYAHERMAFAAESPSVNPQGALIALTKSLVRGGIKDDEVVVVADVFSNGRAQIAEVVEPSRDKHAVDELEKALESDPAYAPFVPAAVENRPESVRVVLKFQSVNVSTRIGRPRRSSS